jgi:hypothetical protein
MEQEKEKSECLRICKNAYFDCLSTGVTADPCEELHAHCIDACQKNDYEE